MSKNKYIFFKLISSINSILSNVIDETQKIVKNNFYFTGIARNVEWREKVYGQRSKNLSFFFLSNQYIKYIKFDVLSFKIENLDERGNIIKYIPVYIEAYKIKGVLAAGDEVKVYGIKRRNGMVKPTEIKNLTINSSLDISVDLNVHKIYRFWVIEAFLELISDSFILFIFFVFIAIILTALFQGYIKELIDGIRELLSNLLQG